MYRICPFLLTPLNFPLNSTKVISCEFIGEFKWLRFRVLIRAQKPDLAIKTYKARACWAATERLNRCLGAINERWLINGRKMKWEMKRCLLRLMKGGLVGGRFVLLSISNLNLLNTARMKREKTVALQHTVALFHWCQEPLGLPFHWMLNSVLFIHRLICWHWKNLNDTKKIDEITSLLNCIGPRWRVRDAVTSRPHKGLFQTKLDCNGPHEAPI